MITLATIKNKLSYLIYMSGEIEKMSLTDIQKWLVEHEHIYATVDVSYNIDEFEYDARAIDLSGKYNYENCPNYELHLGNSDFFKTYDEALMFAIDFSINLL